MSGVLGIVGTRILEGQRINECDKTGAVFYDSTDGLAFGPVFESAEEAERFMSFLAGIDPCRLGWVGIGATGADLYKLWLECGKPDKRPVVQLDESFLSKDDSEHGECLDCDALIDLHRNGGTHCDCGDEWVNGKCLVDDGSEQWSIACSLVEHCFPLFLGLKHGNHDVTDILRRAGVLGEETVTDPEHSCFYAYFKSKKKGQEFLWRLNGWLRDNWHRAYPKKRDSST